MHFTALKKTRITKDLSNKPYSNSWYITKHNDHYVFAHQETGFLIIFKYFVRYLNPEEQFKIELKKVLLGYGYKEELIDQYITSDDTYTLHTSQMFRKKLSEEIENLEYHYLEGEHFIDYLMFYNSRTIFQNEYSHICFHQYFKKHFQKQNVLNHLFKLLTIETTNENLAFIKVIVPSYISFAQIAEIIKTSFFYPCTQVNLIDDYHDYFFIHADVDYVITSDEEYDYNLKFNHRETNLEDVDVPSFSYCIEDFNFEFLITVSNVQDYDGLCCYLKDLSGYMIMPKITTKEQYDAFIDAGEDIEKYKVDYFIEEIIDLCQINF